MSKLTKISLLIFGIVIAIAVVMAILVNTLVTPQKIRAALVPLTEHTLHRKVALKSIHIGLFSGITLQDLQVLQKTGSDNFIAVKSLDMHYRILPLFTGKVVIDNIKLVQPHIVVVRQPDGTFNFQDLLGSEKEKGGVENKKTTQTAPLQTTSKKTSSDAGLNLLVSSVSVSGGQLLFIDKSQPKHAPTRFTLDQLALKAHTITLDKSFPIEFSAMLNGARLSLSGVYNITKESGDADLNIQALNLADFAPYYRQALQGKMNSGRISLSLKTDLSPDKISVKGKVSLDKIDLLLNKYPQGELKQAKLEIDSSLSYQLKSKLLHLSNSIIKFNNIPIRTEGNINLSGPEPNLAMAIFLDHLDLERVNQGLPEGLAKDIQPYNLAGQVNALVELAGKPSSGIRLLQKADLNFENVQANLAGIKTGVNGNVEFAGQELKTQRLQLNLADQPAELSLDASNLLGDHITGSFQLTADTLDFNKLISAGKDNQAVSSDSNAAVAPQAPSMDTTGQEKSATTKTKGQQQKPGKQEIGPFSIPAEINGKITINQGIYKQLNLDHISADILLKDNHFQITKADCDLAGGKLTASADVDLGVKGLAYKGKLALNKLQMAVLDNGLFPDADQGITGTMDSGNTFSGHGMQSPDLLKTLQVDGQTMIQDGQISGSSMLITLASFLGNIDMEKLDFTSLQSQYTMQNGVVSLNGALDSSLIKLKPEGRIAVDGPLDLNLDARLSPAAMSRLGADNKFKQAMTDENGWGVLPLKFEGTVKSPEIALDSKALQKQVVGKARQALEKKLLKKLSHDKNGQQGDQNNIQLLDSTLNKLFGK